MPVKHAFTSGKADGGDATLVQPSNWNADHTIDTHLDYPVIATPATPGASTLRVWARSRAGRLFLNMLDPNGEDTTIQPSLFSNNWVMAVPNTGTTVPLAMGTVWTARNSTGAMSNPTLATTNRYTQMRRMEFAAGAVAGQGSGMQGSFAQFFLGNAAAQGGFFFFCRFGFAAYTAAARLFIGLTTQNAAFAATEPCTVNNHCGIGKDSADANASFSVKNGTTNTKNGTFTPAINTIYDFAMFAARNSTTVNYRLVDETNGTVIFDNLSTSTNTPAVNTLMYPWVHAGASSAVAQTLGVAKIYCESDF